MAKIYIAGKITGLKNYREVFKKAEKELNDKGNVCMNPSVLSEGFEWNEYMYICYQMMGVCDTIYMLKNWIDSKGAINEHDYAIENHMKIIYEE